MSNLENFIQKYDIKKIKELEHNDPQFLALQTCRNKISKKNENLFLFLVLQCAIISYQLSGTWEEWRKETAKNFYENRDYLLNLWKNNENNTIRRSNFLKNSKNNKRINNIKISRIDKFNKILYIEKNFIKYQNKLEKLNSLLANTMKTNKDSKTIVFAIKMFWYTCNIITWKETEYPLSINIPVDSRLKKIYALETNTTLSWKEDIIKISNYFNNISKKYDISPLDLDSILRLDYRKFIKKEKK